MLLDRNDVTDFLMLCIRDVCRSSGKNIKSGWAIVLGIIGMGGKLLTNQGILANCFETLQEIMTMYFEFLSDYFGDVINCFFQFGCNPIKDVSFQAIEKLQWFCDEISNPQSKLIEQFLKSSKGPINLDTHKGITEVESSKVMFCSFYRIMDSNFERI